MSEGPVTTVTRAPASKVAVAVEAGALVGLPMTFGSDLISALAEWNVPPFTAKILAYVVGALVGVGISFLRDYRARTKGV